MDAQNHNTAFRREKREFHLFDNNSSKQQQHILFVVAEVQIKAIMCTNTDGDSDHETLTASLVAEAKALSKDDVSPSSIWSSLQAKLSPSIPYEVHQRCYENVYRGCILKPAWIPSKETIAKTNIVHMMQQRGFSSYQELYDWSIGSTSRNDFWMESMKAVDIQWETQPTTAFDTSRDAAHTTYFPGGRLNISDSCFSKRHSQDPAIVYSNESHARSLRTMSFAALNALSNQIANGLTQKLHLRPGDAVGICMPMTPESIAIYLGIVKAGCVVVSVADSFSPQEIATRCRLSGAKAMFTQDVILRGSKYLPLLERVLQADAMVQEQVAAAATVVSDFDDSKETKSDSGNMDDTAMKVIVLPGMLHAGTYPEAVVDDKNSTWTDRDALGHPVALHESVLAMMREDHDASWYELLQDCSDEYTSVKRDSMDPCNVLFSSGTTGEPKAIVWSHSTPIKCAIDGYYHQDIHVGDRVAWPTNIGWMMGPWLLFQLVNGATIGLFNGITSTGGFCEFVDEAEISMLGVIPSLVKAWKANNATAKCDWSKVKKFSSTGEASDPVTYLWLMSRVPGYAPVLEYCGGTEIGGSFLSSTLVQPNVPSMFSTPVLGSQIMLLDAESQVIKASAFKTAEDGSGSGELVMVPPSIGLSTKLLNQDHYKVYFEGMPCGPSGEVFRKHGDEIEFVRKSFHCLGENGTTPYYHALGRCDDTMNIGGIKVGSVEIERACNLVDIVQESAAIGVSGPLGGPCKLVIYVVLEKIIDTTEVDKTILLTNMQKSIKAHLNPLFGISDVVIVESLPRTASNKVMRRLLRDDYVKSAK
jgi:acetyl-CoA synthetase